MYRSFRIVLLLLRGEGATMFVYSKALRNTRGFRSFGTR